MINKKNIKVTESKAKELFDSLFSDKPAAQPPLSKIKGNLDALNNRSLSGWVVDEEDLDRAVAFEVFFDNTKVGEGVADTFREDLKSIGFGNGKHGFLVGLSSQIFTQGSHELTLREKDTGVLISANKFPVQTKADCVGEIIGFGVREIHAQIYPSGKSENPKSVEILVDGAVRLPCALTNKAGGKLSYEARLPDEVFDAMPHTYELIANDSNCTSTAYVDILQPLLTPVEHLTDSHGKPGYIGLARSAAYRYDSLSRQLTELLEYSTESGTVAAQDLMNLQRAHTEVIRGSHGRRHYQKLTLPKVDNPDVTVIIPAMNKFEITYHAIASVILAQNKATYEVILVDDASSDETTVAEDIVENLVVVRNESNLGFVKSNKAC